MDILKTRWYVWLSVVLLLGAILRFYGLGNLSFVADEFLDVNSSYGYAKTGIWQSWDFNTGTPNDAKINAARDERASVYKWQIAEIFRFVSPNEARARAVSALWGLVSILLVYWSTLYFTGRRGMALMAAFLFSISISALEIDRRVRMYAMFAPVFLAFWWMTFRFLDEPYQGKIALLRKTWDRFGCNFLYLIPVFIFGALSLAVHLLAVNIVAVVLVYALVEGVKKWDTEGVFWNKYVVIWVAFIVGSVLMKLLLPNQFGLIAASLAFPDNNYGYLGIVLRDYGHPLLAVLLFGVGAWFLVRREQLGARAVWMAVSFPTLLFLAIFVWKRSVGEQYIFFAEPFKMMVIGVGMYAVALLARERLMGATQKTFLVATVAVMLLVPNYSYFFQENNTYHQTSRGDRPNYRSIFGYVVKHKEAGDVLITRTFRNYYWRGANIETIDFGGELTKTGQAQKLSLATVQEAIATHPSGWIVLSENDDDYVSNGVEDYLDKNLQKINVIEVRGTASVYHWGNPVDVKK